MMRFVYVWLIFFNIVFIERIFALPFAHLFVTLATLKVLSFFLRFATKASPSSPSAEMKSKKMFFCFAFRSLICTFADMKRIVLLWVLLWGVLLTVPAQVLKDASYRLMGRVEANGVVKDANYRMIGKIESDGSIKNANYWLVGKIMPDGTIKDSSYRMIGKVEKDGTVKDSSYRFIGKVKDDGTVVDQSYRMIGHAKGVPATYAAVMYFFKML